MISPLTTFLERFKKLRPPDETVRLAVIALMGEYCKGDVSLAEVTVKNGTVFVVADPALKSELFLKKRKILGELAKQLGDKAPKDIR